MFNCDRSNLQSNQILAFGNYTWCTGTVLVVLKGDRVVRWVRNDHIGIGYVLQHAPLGRLTLKLPYPCFNFGTTVGLFALVFDLLLRHAHLLVVTPELVGHINSSNQNECGRQ